MLFQHFSTHLGRLNSRNFTLNWEELGIERRNLTHLAEPFTEEEVLAVIQGEKAPAQMDALGCSYRKVGQW